MRRFGLQWGRALMSTEIMAAIYEFEREAGLQWGRALMSTEIGRWRPANWRHGVLQWGRALMSVWTGDMGNTCAGTWVALLSCRLEPFLEIKHAMDGGLNYVSQTGIYFFGAAA